MMPLPNDFKSFSYHYKTNNSERVASLVRAGAFENELLQGKPAWSGMHSLTSEPNEGVYQYHLVTKIYLDRPELFDDLFSMLGIFHTAKTARKYAGKFIIIRGSGVVVCKIPLLARRTRPMQPVGQARRATIGYLVYKWCS